MTNETDRIAQLERRIEELESYLNQFESYRNFKTKIPLQSHLVNSPAKKTNTRGTRLQESWQPSQALVDWATKEFPLVDLPIESAKFVDYWLSRADRGAIKLSWDRTYRNWIRTASQSYRGKRETHKRSDAPSYSDSVRNAFD